MKTLKYEKELLEQLQKDIDQIDLDTVFILAGHFPLRAYLANKNLNENTTTWGEFTPFTLELGAKIGRYAQNKGKNIKFIFLCDDHSYRNVDKEKLAKSNDLTDAQLDNRWRSQRDDLFKDKSGVNAKLPKEIQSILHKFGFDEKDILRHDHKKAGRKDCLYFSESVLRGYGERKINDACAREYVELIQEEIKEINGNKNSFLISFIPLRCQRSICNAIDYEIENFSGSHIFMETGPEITKKNIWKFGVIYKKD